MTNPRNAREMRSIMGVFNQFSSFIPNYGKEGSPARILHPLTSDKVEYTFTKKHENALKELREIVLKGLHLWAPDANYPLILETDGSEDGWGAVLYQTIENEKRVIKMWSKQWKTEAWQKKPPYHREAKAWMNALTLTIPYALQNNFPVECWTDHTPLTWIKHTSGKGPVSQFIIDTLSVVDYKMHYIKGPENKIADSLSRFPMLGPGKLHQKGVAEALNILLSALVGSDADPRRIWFYTGKDTPFMVPTLYDWRQESMKGAPAATEKQPRVHCYMDPLSASKIHKLKYTLGIWAPPADKIVRQCRAAFDKNVPFACLVPNDLVHHIARDQKKNVVLSLHRKVENAKKITLLSPGLTWIIHGINFSHATTIRTVYANTRVTPEFELEELVKTLKDSNLTPPLPQFSTRDKWIEAQLNHQTHRLYEHLEGVYHAPDGLLVYNENPNEPVRTIVPDALQIPLVEWQHKNLCHTGSQKVLTVLKKKFYWANMRRTCRHVVDQCALCNLLKARMRHAHRHYRPRLFCTPRTSYGADYYGVKQNKQGYNNILGIIDLANGHLVLQAVKARTGANTAHVIFNEIIARKGVPLLFHSDAAREFVSTAMKSLCATLGIVQTNTLAHNPKGNAKIERVWAFVGRCLQSMTPEVYAQFHKYTGIIAHVWNTVPDSDTNITPFEAEHGMKCRSVAESILQNPPQKGYLPPHKTCALSLSPSAP